MCLRGQVARDLIKVMLHRLRIGARHDYRRPRAAFGTDRTKQIGRFGTQIGERPWPGAAPRPAPGARVFLAEPHFVLKPHFYRRLWGKRCRDRADTLDKVYGMARPSAPAA